MVIEKKLTRLSQNPAFRLKVRDDTLLHGPANLMGPIKYVPLGIRRFTEPEDLHASFHAALKAWNDKYQLYLPCQFQQGNYVHYTHMLNLSISISCNQSINELQSFQITINQ